MIRLPDPSARAAAQSAIESAPPDTPIKIVPEAVDI